MPGPTPREKRASRDGFGGIGVTINVENGIVRINWSPGSPAAAAGVQVDDQILTIDGEGTAGLDQREVVTSSAAASTAPPRWRPGIVDLLNVPITRQRIVVPTSGRAYRADRPSPILSFNQQTGRSCGDA
jgi:carboxyl-terminal processing protease